MEGRAINQEDLEFMMNCKALSDQELREIVGGSLQGKIKEERLKMGWSQRELAEHLFITDKSVSHWENGKRLPDVFMVSDMAKLFGVSMEELVDDTEVYKK